jgi:ATP-dependent Lhr-like helicase
VVIADGRLGLYVEKGGRSMLTFTDDGEMLARAVAALGDAVRSGTLGTVTIERVDGSVVPAQGPIVDALAAAGFVMTPKGMRLRAP